MQDSARSTVGPAYRAALASFLVLSGWASMPALASDGQVPTAGELARVQAQRIMDKAVADQLTEQVRRAEADAKLAALEGRAGIAGRQGDRYEGGDVTPVVYGVFGANGVRYATFLYSSGAKVDGRPGDTIPGGFKVTAVSAREVVLRDRNGRRVHVEFSASAPSVPTPALTAPQGASSFQFAPTPLPPPPAAPLP